MGKIIKLNLVKGELIRSVIIGIDENSRTGYDTMDKFAPPGDFEKERIVIYNEDLETGYKYLYKDYRPAIGDLQVYDIKLKTITGKTVTLAAEGLEQFENFYTFCIVFNRFLYIYIIIKL